MMAEDGVRHMFNGQLQGGFVFGALTGVWTAAQELTKGLCFTGAHG